MDAIAGLARAVGCEDEEIGVLSDRCPDVGRQLLMLDDINAIAKWEGIPWCAVSGGRCEGC